MVLTKAMTSVKELVTAEALWQMGSQAENYELVRGELIEMTPPGGIHGNTTVKLSARLSNFTELHKLGEVMVETGYRLTSNPDTVRGPDISFFSVSKIPPQGLPDGYINGAPDLAVEIVSPHDKASEVQDKVQDYLAYGTALVWVVYPQQRVIIVHYPDGAARTLRETDTLSGETIIPGFACQVAEIFG